MMLCTPYSVTKLPDESSTMHNLLREEFLNSLTAPGVPNHACPQDQRKLPLHVHVQHFSDGPFDEQH